MGLRFLEGGRPNGGPVSHLILLTELMHVNAAAHSKAARGAFSRKSGRRLHRCKVPTFGMARGPSPRPARVLRTSHSTFPNGVHASEFTVVHKTVAEPH